MYLFTFWLHNCHHTYRHVMPYKWMLFSIPFHYGTEIEPSPSSSATPPPAPPARPSGPPTIIRIHSNTFTNNLNIILYFHFFYFWFEKFFLPLTGETINFGFCCDMIWGVVLSCLVLSLFFEWNDDEKMRKYLYNQIWRMIYVMIEVKFLCLSMGPSIVM